MVKHGKLLILISLISMSRCFIFTQNWMTNSLSELDARQNWIELDEVDSWQLTWNILEYGVLK